MRITKTFLFPKAFPHPAKIYKIPYSHYKLISRDKGQIRCPSYVENLREDYILQGVNYKYLVVPVPLSLLNYLFLIKDGGMSPFNPATKFSAASMAILKRVSIVAEPI